ncbi:hypothetical protein [Corynebacterium glyciniphilum]|uniref:hypothetical protein n=1 Tax=Corynebacterium glyciniphilum TaxID=1404244 RepID=UPI0026548E07|nr:hypothetical protein [Corynebacterium glyciniphilum]MDN6707421.1 hypothetical protein [Corynebacterium glyciniphilum]
MTTDREWHSAGIKTLASDKVEYLVSPWEPGDGVLCTHHSAGARGDGCGRPVAIARTVITNTTSSWKCEREPRIIRRTLCADHLANLYAEKTTTEDRSEIRKKAIEAVIANHHGEFTDILERLTEKSQDCRLESLPEPLKTEVRERLAGQGDCA